MNGELLSSDSDGGVSGCFMRYEDRVGICIKEVEGELVDSVSGVDGCSGEGSCNGGEVGDWKVERVV